MFDEFLDLGSGFFVVLLQMGADAIFQPRMIGADVGPELCVYHLAAELRGETIGAGDSAWCVIDCRCRRPWGVAQKLLSSEKETLPRRFC